MSTITTILVNWNALLSLSARIIVKVQSKRGANCGFMVSCTGSRPAGSPWTMMGCALMTMYWRGTIWTTTFNPLTNGKRTASRKWHLLEEVRFVLLDARNISNKIAELEEVLVEYDPPILAVTETWLTGAIADAEVISPAHNIFRRDRCSRGGGVALIVKIEVSCIVLKGIPDHESLCCQIECRELSTLVVLVNHTSGSPVNIHRHLQGVCKPGRWIILTGNFNFIGVDSCEYQLSINNANLILEIMFPFDLWRQGHEHTRVYGTSRSLLDLVSVNGSPGRNASMIPERISDHKLVFSTLEFPEIKANRQVNTVLSFSAQQWLTI